MSSTITQFGLSAGFLLGLYDGPFTFKQLAAHGDFGHGTFNAVDGEMIALNGDFYRIDVEGKVLKVGDEVTTPIATVIKFKADKVFNLENIKDYKSFQEKLSEHLLSCNHIYAIRVDGVFERLVARSESAQPKPYEALDIGMPKTQRKFYLQNTQGTLVGYVVPEVYKQMVLPGFHFHYINDARDAGGHIYDVEFKAAVVSVQCCDELKIVMPNTKEFECIDLNQDFEHVLKVAERGG